MCNQAYIKKQTWASKMREAIETKAREQQADKWLDWLKVQNNLTVKDHEKDSESPKGD